MIIALLKWTLILLILSGTTFYILFSPSYLSEVNLNGDTIRISRDDYGIPTLHISSIQQFLYGMGIVYAEDRLFQMTFRIYSVQGRLSEFLGEKTLDFDKYMRELNLKGWAEKRAERMLKQDPAQYAKINLLAKAINDRAANLLLLPLQFYLTGVKWQNYTVSHLFYLDIFVEWTLSMNMVDQYTRSILLANYTKEQIEWILPNKKETWAFKSVPIVNDEEIPQRLRTQNVKEKLEKIQFNPLSVQSPIELDIISFIKNEDATNTWAVSGQHTESGFPILSNDPHLQTILPSHWYQVKLNYTSNGKNILAAGRTTPGNPRVFGKNTYFAEGLSISHGDNQDLFREKIEGDKYLVDGKWHDLKIRNQTILIKSGSGLRKEFYLVQETHRGPIIHSIYGALGVFKMNEDTLSLSWTGFNSQWQSFSKMVPNFLIENFAQLQNYLQNHTKSHYIINILAITADNHIITQQSGIHPIRRNAESGTYIKDGTTTEHDWIGLVPPEDRMNSFDPPKGYIIHANNRLAQSGYYGGYLDYTIFTARADRLDELIRQEIKSGRKITVEFAQKLLYDTVDVYCRQILPEITTVVEDSRETMLNFDCDFKAESHLATIYEVFIFQLYHLMKPIAFEKFSLISSHQMQQGIFNYIHFAFKGDEKKQQIMRSAWARAIAHLQGHFATSDQGQWQWGKFHLDAARHIPFKTHPVLSKFYDRVSPGNGNLHTPNVAKMEKLQFGNFQTTHRASIRVINSFGPKDEDYWCDDTGASENIFSGHYADQWKRLIKNQLIPIFGAERRSSEQL